MSTARLAGQSALVTAASREVGRGVALGLAYAGAAVFATGRTIDRAGLGSGIRPIVRDHTDDQSVAASVRRVADESGRDRSGARRRRFDLTNSESPEFVGRAVAALSSDTDRVRWSGRVVVAATLAAEYGFTDVDGRQPRPLSVADA